VFNVSAILIIVIHFNSGNKAHKSMNKQKIQNDKNGKTTTYTQHYKTQTHKTQG